MWFAIVDANGDLISTGTVIATQQELDERGYHSIPLSYDPNGMIWDKATQSFIAPPIPNSIIPKITFIQRFTAQEFMEIRASTDPEVQFFMYQLDNATTVEPQGADVHGALAYLVQIKLLTQARADVIGAN